MAEEEDPQYLIEIQDGVEGDNQEEVMVILDLDEQEMPDSVTQTILHLAQNSRQPISTVRVTKAYKNQTVVVKPEVERLEFLIDEESFQSVKYKAEEEEIQHAVLCPNEDNFSQSIFLSGEGSIQEDIFQSNPASQILMPGDEGIFQQHLLSDNETGGHVLVLREQPPTAEPVKVYEEDLNGDIKTDFEKCAAGLNAGTRIIVKDLIQLEEFRTGKLRQPVCTLNSSSPTEMKVAEMHPGRNLEDTVSGGNKSNSPSLPKSISGSEVKTMVKDGGDFCCPSNTAIDAAHEYTVLKDSESETKSVPLASPDDDTITRNIQCPSEEKVCSDKDISDNALAFDLKLHAMSEHKSKDTQFCSYCSFSCETRAEMNQHRQTHTGKHPYVCDICGFSTAFKAHLERHQSTHSNIKPFKCPECDYSCKEKVNLKKHMVIHRPEKPFACHLCPHRSKLRSLLNSHIRIVHSSLRPYSCNVCNYTCKTLSNLKKHQWIHQGYKPFACRFCSYITCETNKLRRHEKFKHKAEIEEEQKKISQNQEEIMVSSKRSLEPGEEQQEITIRTPAISELSDTGFTKGLFRISSSTEAVSEEDMSSAGEKTFFSNRLSLARLQENPSGSDTLALSMNSSQPQRFIIQFSE
ncbi:zinc finger protein 32 [Elysia marginata]|uniref:Zinc finger protein 32 n=1 Tax=Elysia marginata TaxID=1093978 RepID=A0AAV4G0P6_9GAST|nr:zinc finger protein 32 [Elysia marginata]